MNKADGYFIECDADRVYAAIRKFDPLIDDDWAEELALHIAFEVYRDKTRKTVRHQRRVHAKRGK